MQHLKYCPRLKCWSFDSSLVSLKITLDTSVLFCPTCCCLFIGTIWKLLMRKRISVGEGRVRMEWRAEGSWWAEEIEFMLFAIWCCLSLNNKHSFLPSLLYNGLSYITRVLICSSCHNVPLFYDFFSPPKVLESEWSRDRNTARLVCD